jgi:membrane protease YdiL (CAAX protease family)
MNKFFLELKELQKIVNSLHRKTLIVLMSVAVLQTVSWYFTSRTFFRRNFLETLISFKNIELIEFLYWFVGDFFTFLILPVFIIKFILKEKLKDYGLNLGDYKLGIQVSLIFILFMLPLIWIVSSSEEFVLFYPHLPGTKINWNIFIVYELGMLIYLTAWEFIWRGYMLFGLYEKFGYYSVLIQMIPFLILHNGKPVLETFGAIFGGIALGILALRTSSILYCIFVHASVMFTIDLISVLRFRTSDYNLGVNSLFNLLKQIF